MDETTVYEGAPGNDYYSTKGAKKPKSAEFFGLKIPLKYSKMSFFIQIWPFWFEIFHTAHGRVAINLFESRVSLYTIAATSRDKIWN